MKKSRSRSSDLSKFGKLAEYNRRRRFDVTPEPAGKMGRAKKKELEFVIQKHRASSLHYDFRLEHDGVMLSWAVPKGPSLDPSNKRFAMQTENHPIEYNQFEGVIPEGEYGGGTVMIWDRGTWEPEVDDVDRALAKGDLKFTLHGQKLRGSWVLVRMRERQWLLNQAPRQSRLNHRRHCRQATLGRFSPHLGRDRPQRRRQSSAVSPSEGSRCFVEQPGWS